jgi:hypothetical protein
MADKAPKREDYYLVRGHKGGKPVVVYSGPNAAHAEKSRKDAERSGMIQNLTVLHGYTYPPPERNEDCQCRGNPFRIMACPFGHLTECHYPQACGEAVCGHYLQDQERATAPTDDETATWLATAVKPDDTLFEDSPDTGTKSCQCSRCGKVIKFSDGMAVRVWPEAGGEYRYHMQCLGLAPVD